MTSKIWIVLGLFLSAVIVYVTSPFVNPDNSRLVSWEVKKKYTTAEVPELTQILGSDQTARLNAARKLVERVDVEQALEILENSDLAHTGEGHLAIHQIGFFAYKKYGVESILKCKDYFLYACYHGAIIEAAGDQGFEAISKMTDKCKEYVKRYFQCVHAAGHSINAIWNYDLPRALGTCDQLYERETQFPEVLSSCHNGAFMENLFGVHDWGTDKVPKRDWLSNDMYFPCNAFGEKYQKGCWLNQAARIYQMNGGDLSKTAQICETLTNNDYRTWCFDNLARQIHPLTNGDTAKVFEFCSTVGSARWQDCVVVNAGSYYSVGDRLAAIRVCNQIWPQGKDPCFQLVFSQLASDIIEDSQKVSLCSQVEPAYVQKCLKEAKI